MILQTILVVICLKNRTFAVSQTTFADARIVIAQLWFAWKIVLLQYRKQLHHRMMITHFGCDLLEKSYFCSIANNDRFADHIRSQVVICLKNRTFAVSQTTYSAQLHTSLRCDLLEKSYFCSIANNTRIILPNSFIVVICLKNRTFAVSQTTHSAVLNYQKCCDLLEKSYFCSIANNCLYPNMVVNMLWFAWKIVLLQYRKQQVYLFMFAKIVVICLKNRTFAVSQTTFWWAFVLTKLLWFAWKIVLLQYRKQLISSITIKIRVVICLKNRTFAVSQTT